MKLYICYKALQNLTNQTPRPGGHPCGNAAKALKEAGYEPEIVAVGGLGLFPFNKTTGRKELKEKFGTSWVPVLELDDGTVVKDSKEIVAWAEKNAKTTA